MKVLFIVTRFPSEQPTRGDVVRSRNLLAELANRHDITVAAVVHREPGTEERRSLERLGVELIVVKIGMIGSAARFMSGLWDRRPWQVRLFASKAAAARLGELTAAEPFDLIHAQLVRAGPLVPTSRSMPVTVDLIDALSRNYRERHRKPWPPLAWLNRSEARRLQRYEQHLLAMAAAGFVVSDQDWAALDSLQNVEVIPNGVRSAEPSDRHREQGRVIFSGNLGYEPNIDAARWLAMDIFPAVRADQPDATLRLVGARPHRTVRRLARRPGVSVWADVPDLAAELAASSVAVAPMRTGSGMQNKVPEAIVAGIPVVATADAAGPLGLGAESGVTVADSEADLASAITALLDDPDEAERRAQAALDFVTAGFSWAAAADQVAAAWERVAFR